jgi:hypothetical protein
LANLGKLDLLHLTGLDICSFPELLDVVNLSEDSLVDVTPPPVLLGLERSDDRMVGGVKVLRGVVVL